MAAKNGKVPLSRPSGFLIESRAVQVAVAPGDALFKGR